MRVIKECKVDILTPCLCAGADQARAEIRSPSIRGELRWWFRALGGGRLEEAEVFGSIEAKDNGKKLTENRASGLVIRNRPAERGDGKESSELPGNHKFFVSSRLGKGDSAFIPGGWRFWLQVVDTRSETDELTKLAVDTFLRLGSLGLRARRGCGAIQVADWLPSKSEFDELRQQYSVYGIDLFSFEPQKSAYSALCVLEDSIKLLRTDQGIRKNSRNAMGYVQGSRRHASCLRVKPVRMDNGWFLPVMIYSEAGLAPGVSSIRNELLACLG